MKKAILCIVAMAMTACGTNQPKVDATSIYKAYVQQQRSAPSFEMTGRARIELLDTNSTFVVHNQLQPLSARAKDPNTAQASIEAAERAIKAGLLGYFGADVLKSMSRDPVIVEQPAPVIVDPVIVPAANP